MNKILIVEDDNTIHDMVKEYLNKRGFHCEHAYSGTEALLVQKQENCDLILMDLMLPGLDGKQALTKIKKEYGWNHSTKSYPISRSKNISDR